MPDLKPTRELLRIYGLEGEDGKVHGLMVASQMKTDLVLEVLKQATDMMEKGMDQHLKDVPIKDFADIRLHTER